MGTLTDLQVVQRCEVLTRWVTFKDPLQQTKPLDRQHAAITRCCWRKQCGGILWPGWWTQRSKTYRILANSVTINYPLNILYHWTLWSVGKPWFLISIQRRPTCSVCTSFVDLLGPSWQLHGIIPQRNPHQISFHILSSNPLSLIMLSIHHSSWQHRWGKEMQNTQDVTAK